MGAANSSGHVELTTTSVHTPPKQETAVLVDDPRSPSNKINRTPMRVLQEQTRVPFLDPRSPSKQIDRTPLRIEKENFTDDKRLDGVKMVLDYEKKSITHPPLADKNT